MLCIRPAVSVPAVVRNVHQHLCPFLRKLANFIGEDRLVADEDAQLLISGYECGARSAAGEVPDLLGEAAGESEHPLEWNVLAERHQVDFVVAAIPVALRIHQCCGIKNVSGLLVRQFGVLHANTSSDNPRVRTSSNLAEAIAKKRITGVERRRRLRPDDEASVILQGGTQA